MTNKNKLTTADLVIAKHFGEASAEFYGDDFEKLETYLKENKIEDIQWFESKKDPEFAKKAAERFAPLVVEIAEKNRKSKAAFARLKELVASKPSIKEIIESTEKGMQGVLASAKDDLNQILKTINLLSSPEGLIGVAAGVTRAGATEDKTHKEIPFKLTVGAKEYNCSIKHEVESITILINCDDQSKEFFITGNGYTQSGKPANGSIEFSVPDKGEYIISIDGEYFRAISLE